MSEQSHSSLELARQMRVEYGDRAEVLVRLFGTAAGCGVLYGYTRWPSAWVWLGTFLASQAAYFGYLKARMSRATPLDEHVSGFLFLVLLASFLWMPAQMICEQDRALSISGAALIGCILVFLVRRSDSAPIMVHGEVAVVALVISSVFFRLIPQFTDPFAKVGLVVCGSALLYYFAEAARVSRQLRIEAADATARSLQTEKLAAIGRLAGGIAHDFNNNLTAILGHLELLSVLEDEDDRSASIAEATVAANQAAHTVRQLLAFARKERISLARQNSGDVLAALVALTRRLIPTSIEVLVNSNSQQHEFQADRAQLLSALINLVVNSADAMPTGGKIVLSSVAVDLPSGLDLVDGSRLQPGPYVRISVQDEGGGIPKHLLSRVLEPFFTTKPIGKGTGLGLPAVLGVARNLGGGLTIDSSAAGTTVGLFIPAV